MKLARLLAWICLVIGCIVIALAEPPAITGVEAVGVTVSDLDRSIEFYTQVLHFQKQWQRELSGAEVEHLKGVFGVRMPRGHICREITISSFPVKLNDSAGGPDSCLPILTVMSSKQWSLPITRQ